MNYVIWIVNVADCLYLYAIHLIVVWFVAVQVVEAFGSEVAVLVDCEVAAELLYFQLNRLVEYD